MPVETRTFTLPLHCRYLLRPPPEPAANPLLVAALHGHGMTPEQMLELVEPLIGPADYIASLQGPYQFWTSPGDPSRSQVSFHWNTSFEPQHSRRLHHEMILHVLGEVRRPAVLFGYSQSVSLNYRFLCTYPEAVRGAIAICGGLPGDWDTAPYRRARAALHIAARDDAFYPPARTEAYRERLREHIEEVEFHLLEGPHRIPSAAKPLLQAWLERMRA
jgi:phospholipase/carboxylesterase